MRLALLAIFLVLMFFLGVQLYELYEQRAALITKSELVGAKAKSLEDENGQLTADLEYFANLKNLVKEFKSLFNYRNPDEKLIIIVPKNSE